MKAAAFASPDAAVSREKPARILLGDKTDSETACEKTKKGDVYLPSAACSARMPAPILLGNKKDAEEPFEKTESAAISPPSAAGEETVSDEPFKTTQEAAVFPPVAALSEKKPAPILLGDKTATFREK